MFSKFIFKGIKYSKSSPTEKYWQPVQNNEANLAGCNNCRVGSSCGTILQTRLLPIWFRLLHTTSHIHPSIPKFLCKLLIKWKPYMPTFYLQNLDKAFPTKVVQNTRNTWCLISLQLCTSMDTTDIKGNSSNVSIYQRQTPIKLYSTDLYISNSINITKKFILRSYEI